MGSPGSFKDEEDDEYDPLFDYRSIQPTFSLDDDSSDDDDDIEELHFHGLPKKRKSVSPAQKRDFKDEQFTVIDDEEEDDWLAPPRKLVKTTNVSVDISQARSAREKLSSLLTVSGEDLIRNIEKIAKSERNTFEKPDLDKIAEETLKPASNREKIIISIQDKNGNKQFRLYRDDKFEKLFKAYMEQNNCRSQNFVFMFDGEKVSPNQTPEDLDLLDEDIIEAYQKNA